jgi:alcohol dehydrogenase
VKAAVLDTFGSPLAIETLPDPTPGTREVVVDVVAAGVTGYAAAIFARSTRPTKPSPTPARSSSPRCGPTGDDHVAAR